MKKVSLNDIAIRLGVSKTLVSMVLNKQGDKNGISRDTQEKVWNCARELNYKPNFLARSLRVGRTNTLGLIVADISNIFYSRLARVMEDEAGKHGYNLIICSTDERIEKELDLIEMLRSRQVDGLILSSTQEKTEGLQQLIDENFPFVLIDRCFKGLKADAVVVNNYQGAKESTDHLIENGCRNIGILAISPLYNSAIQERIRGCRDSCEQHGIQLNEHHIKSIPFQNIELAVEEAIDDWYQNGNPPDAVFSLNNRLSIHFMQACKKRDIAIPQQTCLASFDDIEFFSLLTPSVTAVAQPFKELGQKAVELLINRIEEKGNQVPGQQIVLDTSLKIRNSTKK